MLNCPKVVNPLAAPETGPAQTSAAAEARLSGWTKPVLIAYGDVRQLTMGVSTGAAESGPPFLLFS